MKYKIFALLLALVMLIGIIPFTSTEVQAVGINATSEDTGIFTKSFTLHLVNKDDPNKTETHTVTYDVTGWSKPKSSVLPAYAFAYIGEVKDIAYSNGEWSYTPVLQLDQSDAEKLAAADVMIATGEVSAETRLNLEFKHVYAKVTFNVTLASEFEPEIDTISQFDAVTCGGDYVKPYIDGNSYTAVIPANPYYQAGVHFALVTINEKLLEVEISDKYANPNGSLAAGTHYTFDLKVGKDKVEIETVTVSGDFPGGWEDEVNLDGTTDIIGTPDVGKTAWDDGDYIVVDFTSSKHENERRGVKYSNNMWTGTLLRSFDLYYLENETPTVSAIYSPYYVLDEFGDIVVGSNDGDGITKGECEYIVGDCKLSDGKTVTVDFSNATRNYSRIRIAAQSNRTLRIGVTNFIPAGSTKVAASGFYQLVADADGNAFLYGTFAEGGSISVHDGDNYIDGSYAKLADYTFGETTEAGKSYALDARPKLNLTFTEAEVATGYYEIKDLALAAKCDMHFECKNAEQKPGGAVINVPVSLDYEIKISAVFTDQNGVTQVLATTGWCDSDNPDYTKTGGDKEEASLSVTQEMLTQAGVQSYSFVVEARAMSSPDTPLNELDQVVHITGSVTN